MVDTLARVQDPGVAEVDRVLEEILARPDFASPPRAPLWRALGAAWDWFWARLGDLLEWLVPGIDSVSAPWSVGGRVVLAVLAVVGVALLLHLGRLGMASLRRRGPAGRRSAETGTSDDPVDAEGWEARARSAAERGRFRDAAVALYQAVIHRLAREERVRFDPGKTPGDYRREVGDDPRAGPLLEAFVRRWEPVAFGRTSAGPGSWDELLGLARALDPREESGRG